MNPDNPARSIAVRLAAMFALAALGVFSLLAFTLDRELATALRRQQVEQLDTKFEDINYIIERLRGPEQWPRVHNKLDALGPPDGGTRYWLLSDDPQIRHGEAPPELAAFTPGGRHGELRIAGRAAPLLVRSADYPADARHAPLRFVVAIDTASFARTLLAFRWVLLGCACGGTLLVAALGYLIAQWGLVPLKRLSGEAQALSPSNLSQRLATAALPAELGDLAQSFNGALDRLEAAYQRLESFNADVTHELRTPLSNLIGQTQVALSRERGTAELAEVLHSNLEELERLRAIVNDMLFLARANLGERPQRMRPTSLAAEVGKTVEFLDLLLDEAGVTVRVQGDVQAPVEPALFCRAVNNLIDNAIRHAQAGSEIVVALAQEGGQARLSVANRGPAIAAEHLERLFDRFYRVDPARANSGEHQGLGLAIVKAVAAMHAGGVFASSREGVTAIGFSVSLSA